MFHKLPLCFRLAAFCSLALVASGCASITGSPMHSVRIDSDPQNARYTITDEAGTQVATGTTPDTVTLRTSAGVFQRSRYFITYESPDYQNQTNNLNATLSPWYLANILFSAPGFVGLLVVDPFTGALYRLPDEASVVFGKEASQ